LQVNEGLRIAHRTNEVSPLFYNLWLEEEVINGIRSLPLPSLVTVTDYVDQIDGHNIFYGGQIGMRADWQRGSGFVELIGKVAFGQTNEVVKINGVTVRNADGNTTSAPGGFFAQSTNSGRFTQSVFAVVPELTVRTGVFYGSSRLYVGYNFLYLSRLVRPGDQIDRALLPPPANFGVAESQVFTPHPELNIKQSDFWAQGLMIGWEVRY
jgi:putative beta barrel porin BBP7